MLPFKAAQSLSDQGGKVDEYTGQATQGSVSSPALGEHNRFADRGKASNRGTDDRMGNGSTNRGVFQSMAGGGKEGLLKMYKAREEKEKKEK